MQTLITEYLRRVHTSYLPQRLFEVFSARTRQDMYASSIERYVTHATPSYVLCAGPSAVVNAMTAIRAGAERVVVIDPWESFVTLAKTLVERNGFAHQIRVLHAPVDCIASTLGTLLNHKFDLVVLDDFDAAFFGGGHRPLLLTLHETRSIDDRTRILPSSATIYACAIELSTPASCGFKLNAFDRYRWNFMYDVMNLSSSSECRYLSAPIPLLQFNLREETALNKLHASFPIEEQGTCNAIAVWWEIALDEHHTLSTKPNETNTGWDQAVFYCEVPRTVQKGDVLHSQFVVDRDQLKLVSPPPPRVTLDRASVAAWHFPMLSDDARNRAYDRAITHAVAKIPHARVLDIGTGTGLLAMMASRAGATHVTGCEVSPHMVETAKRVLDDNRYKHRIDLVNKVSFELSVPRDLRQRANLLVSEIVDHSLLGEGILHALMHARRHLIETNAVLVPASARLFVTGIELRADRVNAFDVSTVNVFHLRHYHSYDLSRIDYRRLTKTIEAFRFNFYDTTFHPEEKRIELPIISDGTCNAFALWYDLYLDDDTVISTAPGSEITAWEQAVIFTEYEIEVTSATTLPTRIGHDLERVYCVLDQRALPRRGIHIDRSLANLPWHEALIRDEMDIAKHTHDITRQFHQLHDEEAQKLISWIVESSAELGFDAQIVSDFIKQLLNSR